MTDDIRHTLCHKSGKLLVWCFNRLRIQTLPIILRMVGSQEYVVCHRSFSHPPLFTGPLFTSNFNRVCPVRYHNQCHIPFQRLRAQNE